LLNKRWHLIPPFLSNEPGTGLIINTEDASMERIKKNFVERIQLQNSDNTRNNNTESVYFAHFYPPDNSLDPFFSSSLAEKGDALNFHFFVKRII
jgi:hypothetical protein